MTPTRVRTLADGEEIVFMEAPRTAPSGEPDPRDLAVARRMRALLETGGKSRVTFTSGRKPLAPRDAD